MKPYFNEDTVLANANEETRMNETLQANAPAQEGKRGSDNAKIAAGLGAAAIGGGTLGAGVMYATGAMASDEEPAATKAVVNSINEKPVVVEEPQVTVDEDTAHKAATAQAAIEVPAPHMHSAQVNNGMSFADAFAAARAEVGPGGIFEWHGGVYGTYTKNEWNAMTPAQQASFTANAMNRYGVTHAENDAIQTEGGEIHIHHHYHNNGNGMGHAAADADTSATLLKAVDGELDLDGEPEVHIIGMHTVDAAGDVLDIADIEVGGYSGLLVDTDRDGAADFMAVDFDGDGEFSEDEIVLLSGDYINPENGRTLALQDIDDVQVIDTDAVVPDDNYTADAPASETESDENYMAEDTFASDASDFYLTGGDAADALDNFTDTDGADFII
ncbi:MAG: hypothetical protein J6M53_07150 [Bacteroidaceae bacterium]|nr:hypothetical protein [Bacteroidaceae bacterium]